MTRKMLSSFGKAAFAAIVVTACAEQNAPMGVDSELRFARGGAGNGAAELVNVQQRARPSAGGAASGVLGPQGGTLVAGECTLTVPRGALSEDTRITVVDRGGFDAACVLAPHGLQYNKAATLTVGGLGSGSRNIADVGGYFAGDIAGGKADVLERAGGRLAGGKLTLKINHHSGWTICGDNCECMF